MNETGVIYILTNPSFPEYVKIGYSDNIRRRVEELNRSECIPFAFRIYAYYKVTNRLSDKKVHDLIDGLNPNLRSIENINGKERKREFYAMTNEQAYSILMSIAVINSLEKNLVLVDPTAEEINDEREASEIENTPIDLKQYYTNKNDKLIKLHEELFRRFKSKYDHVYEEIKPNYIAIRNENGQNICEVHIYKSQILLVTRIPNKPELLIGEKVPNEYLWSLNYKIYFNSESDIEKIVDVLCNIYEQIKKK